ncbi:imidazole glycerol phosphate synthase subunit HisH [Candidatus Hodgkinia cicadicola]
MKVAVVDYEAGNIKSVCGVLRAAARMVNEVVEVCPTRDPEYVARCDKLVLPGVGSYLSCYRKLNLISDMVSAIKHAVVGRGVEFLGICVGMQLLASAGLEEDKKVGFGWLPGIITKLDDTIVRVPHMGWNGLTITKRHCLFASLPLDINSCKAYFVHSYEYIPLDFNNVLATTIYGKTIVAAVLYHNVVGTQFHPEKSHWVGVHFCRNFLCWDASARI